MTVSTDSIPCLYLAAKVLAATAGGAPASALTQPAP